MNRNEQIQEMARTICDLNTDKGCFCDGGYCNYNCLAYEKAKTLYAKGYRKVKLGEWRLIGNANGGFCGGVLYYRCTCCGYEITQARIGEANFCEWCGADMRGENDEKQ